MIASKSSGTEVNTATF